jgi:hypothetical protein
MTANVLTDASGAPGATVTFKTTKPDGRSAFGSAVTDSNGVATYVFQITTEKSKRTDISHD